MIEHLKNKKVFGIGFSKTGTTSLEHAFMQLGLNVCRGHWQLKHNDYNLALYCGGLYDELKLMTTYWDAFADGPWGGGDLYQKLVEWHPEAYYIHTIRDPEKWYNSLVNMIAGGINTNEKSPMNNTHSSHDIWLNYHKKQLYGSALFFRHIFNGAKLSDKKSITEYYKNTNDQIEKFYSLGKWRYIKLDITNGDGWEKLAPFLDVPIPKLEFPAMNKGRQ